MVSKLHEILKPFLLRRIKADVETSLPAKQEIVLYAPLTDVQKDIQDKIVGKTLISEVSDMAKQTGQRALLPPLSHEPCSFCPMPWQDPCQWRLHIRGDAIASCPGAPHVISGGAGVDLAKLNNILMQLRKNCNHPDLLSSEWDPTAMFPDADTLVEQCGKMQVLDRLLTRLKAGGHKVLIFSQVCPSSLHAPAFHR